MSIPLVQNNEKDSINTSIIAIKRQIERINALLGLSSSEEIDTSVFATKTELEDAVTQVETALAPVDEVTADNMQSVTSNGVAEAIAKIPPNYAQKELIFNGNTSYRANYTAPDNGYIMGGGYGNGQNSNYIYFTINGVNVRQQGNADEYVSGLIPVRKGDIVTIVSYFSLASDGIYFIPCN